MNIVLITDTLLRSKLPATPGCYWLIATAGRPGPDREFQFRPVPRMTIPDPYGVLYIGQAGGTSHESAGTLATRPAGLAEKLIRGVTGSHLPLWDYAHSDRILRDMFPLETLALAWVSTATAVEADQLEADSLYRYRNRFGELPPFNRALPDRPLKRYGRVRLADGREGRYAIPEGSYVPWAERVRELIPNDGW